MRRSQINFLFLNVGHFYDHFFVLIFATVAALTLASQWQLSYGALIAYATPGFIAFGICTIPAGWLADKWSREGMMVVFFVGIGASAILTALAGTPVQMAAGLLAVGVFAAIYHPVGLALVVEGRTKTGVPLAINGVFGNMGVACAALITGYFIDQLDWRWAFVVPGVIAIVTGAGYAWFLSVGRKQDAAAAATPQAAKAKSEPAPIEARIMVRLVSIVLVSTALGGLLFQSGTFTLPKIFDERLPDLAATATLVGWYAFLVFTIAALAQLVVGYLVDRHSIRTVFAGVATLQAVFFFAMQGASGPVALAIAIGFMLMVFGQIPINDVLVARVAASHWRSRLYAIRYIVTFSVMAGSLPLIAWVHSNWGFDLLFRILAVTAVGTLACVLMLPRTAAVTGKQEPVAEQAAE